MRVLSSAVSLNVEDVLASSTFLVEHFAFREQMAADGFASLSRADSGMNVVFLRRGLPTLPTCRSGWAEFGAAGDDLLIAPRADRRP
jgi:hypothetical protein